jgi:alpha-tubulin suppressor-like RCC1 family protein
MFAIGPWSSCGISQQGLASCTGYNSHYPWSSSNLGDLLGDGSVADRSQFGPVAGGKVFTQISGMNSETCGIAVGGQLWCWGINPFGSFGNGTTTGAFTPTLGGLGRIFKVISVGISMVCGIDSLDDPYCWGSVTLANFATSLRLTPTLVGGGKKFRVISAGYYHACGIAFDDRAYCWGPLYRGQLGPAAIDGSDTPILADNNAFYADIGAAIDASCGLTKNGVINCWGDVGQFGYLGTMTSEGPYSRLSVGSYHACALEADGQAFCWGNNGSGQTGNGDTSGSYVTSPMPVASPNGGAPLLFKTITAGEEYTCGQTLDGDTYCWGLNVHGNIGDGTLVTRFVPTKVILP